MVESFENLDSILHDWAKDKYKKSISEAMNRYEKHSLGGNWKRKPFLFQEVAQKQFLSSPQSTETKANTKLVLVSRKQLLNKLSKQNVYEIDSFNKFNFSQWQKTLDTLINV